MSKLAYSFKPAAKDDLPMLRRWLRTTEIVRWWGDPEEQAALLKGDLDDPRMRMWIVSFKMRPFAYAQDYAIHDWPQPHFDHLPPGSRAIDAFIGEPDMIGCGHGSVFLRILAEQLRCEGAPAVAIDPDEGNLRAWRAYRKAGFRGDCVVDTETGPAILMVFEG
jgi:aminoglycoside 6'-N-acetyltransferase